MKPGTEAWQEMLDASMPETTFTHQSRTAMMRPRNNVRGSVRISRGRFKTSADIEKARQRLR